MQTVPWLERAGGLFNYLNAKQRCGYFQMVCFTFIEIKRIYRKKFTVELRFLIIDD